MNKWKYFLRNHFGFNQKETNGFIYLIGFLFFALLITIGVSLYYPEASLTTAEDRKVLAQLVKEIPAKDSVATTFEEDKEHSFNRPFNPNTIEKEELGKILGKKLAATIVNYRNKGGHFYKKEDLLRIYGMDRTLYEKILPWVKIDNESSDIKERNVRNIVSSFDINKADTVALQSLKGIGKTLAARIIKFRDKLGGFYAASQYDEIFGLSPDALVELKNRTYIREDFLPAKISLNNSSAEVLFSHPYIGKKNGYSILNYRRDKGGFKTIEELKSVQGMSEETYKKIFPYIIL